MKTIALTAAASCGPLLALFGVILGEACLAAAQPSIPARGAAVTKPAARWEEAFLSGNGRMGVMMFGRPDHEIIVVNHCRLYLPRGSREIVPDLGKLLPQIKAVGLKGGPGAVHAFLRAEATKRGHERIVHTDPYHPAFILRLKAPGAGKDVKNYLMTEDFASGELAVRWTDARGDWERKLFVSRPDDVAVLSIAGPAGQVACELAAEITHALVKPEITATGGLLRARAVYVKGKGGYDSVIKVIAKGGKVAGADGRITVTGANKVLVLMRVEPWRTPLPPEQSEAWAYSPRNPEFGPGHKTNLLADITAALGKLPADYPALLKRHVRIHGELFNRVSLDLGGAADRAVISETLLDRAAKTDRMSPALMEKMYDACRYLTICSSGEVVPNLQGIWTGTWSPAWSGDWTLDSNIHLEINSMMSANLPEFMQAYFALVESWLPDCRLNARKLYGCRGIVTNARASNTCLLIHWGRWPGELYIAGAGWLAHYFHDYTLYTGDRAFLAKRVVPLLKEIALFYEDLLAGTEGPDGTYQFVISYSPELGTGLPNATFDIAVAREVLGNLIRACEDLGVEKANVPKWKAMLAKMPPYLIGKDGAIKEWACARAVNGPNYNHRHYSLLYPLATSLEFSPEATPKLWRASAVALDNKARHWLRGKKPNSNNITHGMMNHAECAARLGRGDVAGEVLSRMATRRYLMPSFMIGYWPNRKGFGFDAVGTIPNVVNNALVFSLPGRLDLLPALPSAWPKGAIHGILARGQVTINRIEWNVPAGKLVLELTSGRDQTLALRLAVGKPIETVTVKGAEIKDDGPTRQLTLTKDRRAVVNMTF